MSDLVPINFLPVDLQRWDADPGGDVLVVPIWSDVRPLRGAAGLLDWRLCGKVSQMLREGRVAGSVGEKLLLLTGRVRWRPILGIGAGPSHAFGDGSCTAALDCALEAAHGLGTRQLALAIPGRDLDLVKPERAMQYLLESIEKSRLAHGAWLERLTVIDASTATKSMAELAKATAKAKEKAASAPARSAPDKS